jgi:hypothetical protein
MTMSGVAVKEETYFDRLGKVKLDFIVVIIVGDIGGTVERQSD